jgi:hypothetical protein
MAERVFRVSSAIIDTDRLWSRSSRGLDAQHVGRRHLAIARTVPFVVEDATAHPDFSAPVVPGVMQPRFYAGVALTTADGLNLGTLCLVDATPRRFRDEQLATLIELGAVVVDTLELGLAGERRSRTQRVRSPAETLEQLHGLRDASLHALILALEARDAPTSDHSLAVVGLARSVASALALPAAKITEVVQVALLHDIGKVGMPDNILHKRGHLDSCERSRMHQHPAIGEKIVGSLRELRHLAPAIRGAHERWDGGGYPDGLHNSSIPIASRIVFACDAYDAMTTGRPYRRASSEASARAELRDHSGTQFDPQVIDVLIPILEAGESRPPMSSASRFSASGWKSHAVCS